MVKVWGKERTFINGYGPTEATIGSTAGVCTPDMEKPTIGKVFPNKKVYILNQDDQVQPIGIPGELCIGGEGLARGYWNLPELTKEKFVRNPFIRGEKMYRTGDLARWLPDGSIDYIGRIDDQINIRGYRIEPSEIEHCLLQHKQIMEAVVLNHKNKEGQATLLAYYVKRGDCSSENLRLYLLDRLPRHMVPAFFQEVKSIPLTNNGKKDKEALIKYNEIEIKNKNYVEASNSVEKLLVEILEEILSVGKIGIYDNFISMGGNSLTAVLLRSRISQVLNVNVTLKEIFDYPILKDLARFICKMDNTSFQQIKKVKEQNLYPASTIQKRLYIIQQLPEVGCAYNLPLIFKINGKLNGRLLESSLTKLIEKHEILRTSFHLHNDRVVQKIHSNGDFEWLSLKCENEEQALNLIRNFIKPFTLEKASQIRGCVIELNDNEHFLLLDMHHIIMDGMSKNILIKELSLLYQGIDIPSPKLQYKDYSVWESELKKNQTDWSKKEEFWLHQFSDELPILKLPTDYQRPPIQQFKGRKLIFKISKEMTNDLKLFAKNRNVTLFMLLFTVYNVLLSKYSEQEDIIVGTTLMGRYNREFESLLGMFVNTLPIRSKLSQEQTFDNLLIQFKNQFLEIYQHGDYSLEELINKLSVPRDISRNPIFDTMFTLQNIDVENFEIQDLSFKQYDFELNKAVFDMTWEVVERETLQICVEYNTDLFKRSTIENMFIHFKHILLKVTSNPNIQLSNIKMITDDDEHKILNVFNQYEVDYSRDKTLQFQFEEQVKKSPETKAVVFEDNELTYQELNEKANQLAYKLREKGVKREDFIGIMTERSVEMIVGVLGVLKAGGAYLPLDPTYPNERIEYMLQDSGAKYVLTHGNISVPETFSGEIVKINDLALTENPKTNLKEINESTDLAYLIYTSGTTGKPKGVMVEHKSVTNFCLVGRTYGILAGSHVLQFSSFSFDAAVGEIFPTLLSGATLYIVSNELVLSGNEFTKWIEEKKIESIVFPPSMLRVLPHKDLPALKTIITAGEMCTPDLIKKWGGNRTFINAYGPTEATVGSTVATCSSDMEKPPIGRPLPNKKIYIVDKNYNLQPVGVPGELCIGGEGLARGYWNLPELTEEKFVQNPFIPGEKIYKTGDLARWLPNGDIDYLGRIDKQVKIRGYRIEPEEIENFMLAKNLVKEIVVIADEIQQDRMILSAYFVANEKITSERLRNYLHNHLPNYMVPTSLTEVKQMPLTKNGKVDKMALLEINRGVKERKPEHKSISPIERMLVQIWEEVLMVKNIGIHDNFIDLGGDSIKAMQVISRLYQNNFKLSVKDVFDNQTIFKISAKLQKIESFTEENHEVVGEVPRPPIHEWFFEKDMDEPHHWNQTMLLTSKEGWIPGFVEQTFEQLIKHHDVLRMKVTKEKELIIQDTSKKHYKLNTIDLTLSENITLKIKNKVNQLQRELNLEKGPLINVTIFNTKSESYLLIIIHHIIIDGVSWRILIEDLNTIYNRLSLNSSCTIKLPKKTLSYKTWSEKLQKYANSNELIKELNFWENIEKEMSLFLDNRRNANRKFHLKEYEKVGIEFDEYNTSLLLKDVHNAYGTELNQILITALVLILKDWKNSKDIALTLEGHGREEVIDGDSLNRTIGWFTSLYPCVFKLNSVDLTDVLKYVKETLNGIPNKGVGYGILKYLTPPSLKMNIDFKVNPEIIFNYMGIFDQQNVYGFDEAPIPMGNSMSPLSVVDHLLEVNALIINNKLQISYIFNKNFYSTMEMEELLRKFKDQLIEIIEHCSQKKQTEATPSDFSAKLSTAELEEILNEINKLEV
ncbi:non-ribosomal peptide synthetase [Bacillus safensis]|uniref:non-ribosomal peptide synthetase n=5 Tax=Bacillus safensis TaxID=561879 RepID=UPI0023D82136|nr:non-ribosomal peptide synthetase [Bacillus safensis]